MLRLIRDWRLFTLFESLSQTLSARSEKKAPFLSEKNESEQTLIFLENSVARRSFSWESLRRVLLDHTLG